MLLTECSSEYKLLDKTCKTRIATDFQNKIHFYFRPVFYKIYTHIFTTVYLPYIFTIVLGRALLPSHLPTGKSYNLFYPYKLNKHKIFFLPLCLGWSLQRAAQDLEDERHYAMTHAHRKRGASRINRYQGCCKTAPRRAAEKAAGDERRRRSGRRHTPPSARPARAPPPGAPAPPEQPLGSPLTVRAAGRAGRQAQQGQPAQTRRGSRAAGRHATAAFPAAPGAGARQRPGSRSCSAPQRGGGLTATGGQR